MATITIKLDDKAVKRLKALQAETEVEVRPQTFEEFLASMVAGMADCSADLPRKRPLDRYEFPNTSRSGAVPHV